MSKVNFFAPITKVDAEKREVWGTLAEEALDKTREVFDYNESKPYFRKWNDTFTQLTTRLGIDEPSVGNVREMHTKAAAGKFTRMDYDDDAKRIDVVAKIEDDQAWRKVCSGVYTGFSIGGDYIKRYDDPNIKGAKRYVADPSEGSLVDNPCMYGATFSMFKSDGSSELRKFVGGDALQKMVAVEVAKQLKKGGKTKRVDNTDLGSSAFLIVGDENDPETWHLPVHFPTEEQTVNHIHAAMGRVNQVEGVSHQVKSGAARRLASLAAKHGIEVKEFNQKFLSTEFPHAVKKSMYDVGRLAEMMQMLVYLEEGLVWEREIEGDKSEVPASLKLALDMLGKIFLDLAKEEVEELLRVKEAEKAAEVNLMKGGGPEMSATIEQLKKGIEGVKTPEDLVKFKGLLAKAADHMSKLADHVDKMRDTHDKQGDCVDGLNHQFGKAKDTAAHEHVTALSKHHEAMGDHLDKAEGCIEDFESDVDSEVDKDENQKSRFSLRITKRLEHNFERQLAKRDRVQADLLNKFIETMERMSQGGQVQEPGQPVVPARTFVAPEKQADATGVGGVVITKGAPAAGTIVDEKMVKAVGIDGMPNPDYVSKSEAQGSNFDTAAKKAKLQSGNPFPKEFGSDTIF